MAAAAQAPAAVSPSKTMAAVRFEPWMGDQLLEIFADMHHESPVMSLFKYNENRIKAMIHGALVNPGVVCGLACIDFTSESIVGILVAGVSRSFFSDEPMVNDLVFYLRPEYRNEFVMKHLLDGYLSWAQQIEIKHVFFAPMAAAMPDKMMKSLKALGWKSIGQQMFLSPKEKPE